MHTAAVIATCGTVLGTQAFSTTRAGYGPCCTGMRSHGEVQRVGVEQTGTFGAGLSRHLALAGVPVLEVTGPEPAERRSKGKDDELDAVAAARAALTGQRVQVAKDRSGAVEALRVLRTTRGSAVRCRRAALQQLRNSVLAAPDEVREPLRHRDAAVASRMALKALARRILSLSVRRDRRATRDDQAARG